MKYYLVDEIQLSDMEKIAEFLGKNTIESNIGNVFWVEVPKDLLNDIQYTHIACAPHVIAVELDRNSIKFEFFIRSMATLNCQCQVYSDRQQRDFILNYADKMLNTLGICT